MKADMDFKTIDKIVTTLGNSHNTVVVTGAGISTEAGIPDFRGQNGIYRQLGENHVMNILNASSFQRDPERFWEFYRQYFIFPPVEPARVHCVLAQMEKKGRIKGVVTQNIDGLHEKAGSKRVLPIHGTADRHICQKRGCGSVYDNDYVNRCEETIPTCTACGGILKPDVVLFGENIKNYAEARDMIRGAQVVVVIGSSLTVYPLAGFVKECSAFYQDLIIINKGPTQMDHAALAKIDGGHTGDVLAEIDRQMDLLGY